MALWALIDAGTVRELTSLDPAGRFCAGLQWVACPDATLVGSAYAAGAFTAPSPPPPTLAGRLAELAAARYARETLGVMFQAAGASAPSLVASDEGSQAKLVSAFVAAGSGHWTDGVPWKMAEGSFVPLTAADVQAMAVKVQTYVATCYAHEAQLAAALATNLATDITLGWPANT